MRSQIKARIYLEDTDAGGIVYHANYLKFMERARTEFLRNVGLEQSGTYRQDIAFVVHSMSVEFVRPARLDDVIVADCEVLSIGGARLEFRQRVCNEAVDVEYCRAVVTVACISYQSQRPRRIPASMREQLEAS